MRPAKYFYDKLLPKYLDPITVLIYCPHPVHVHVQHIYTIRFFKPEYVETDLSCKLKRKINQAYPIIRLVNKNVYYFLLLSVSAKTDQESQKIQKYLVQYAVFVRFFVISSIECSVSCAKKGAEINTIYQCRLLLQYCATKISKVGQLKKTKVKPITRKLKRNYRNTKQCLLPPRDWAPVIKSSTPDFTPKIIYKFS